LTVDEGQADFDERTGPRALPPGVVRVRVALQPLMGPPPAAVGSPPVGSRPVGQPTGRRRGRRPRTLVVLVSGLAWAVLLLGASDVSPIAMGVVVTPVVVIAVLSAWRVATHERFGGPTGVAVGALLLLGVTALAAIGGPIVMIVWVLAGGGALVWSYRDQPRPVLSRGLAAGILPAVGGGCLVLADRQGAQIAMVLIGAYCLFDVANAAMGTGRTGGKVGAVSGIVTVGVLAVIVQSILAPPFTGSKAWVLCGAVGVLAPFGVWICARLAPGRLPALRRLDSLVFAGPAWVIGVRIILHH
jgi:hypothetical protein